MSEKNNKLNLLPSIAILLVVTTAAILMGLYAYSEVDDTIQGQVDVDEYRVSSKVPGRVLSIRVREGQTVHAGDTLALLEAPDVQAKLSQAEAARDAAAQGHGQRPRRTGTRGLRDVAEGQGGAHRHGEVVCPHQGAL